MSRIGKKPISIVSGVKVQLSGSLLTVEGPKGKLAKEFASEVKIQVANNQVEIGRQNDEGKSRALHGLTRSVIQNMIHGVTNEFVKNLQIEGVGFKAQVTGKTLQLTLGFSHPINYLIPDGVKVEAPKPTQLVVKGADRQLVGQVASDIRRFFKPEPYKGKGIRYADEQIRKKKGKAVE